MISTSYIRKTVLAGALAGLSSFCLSAAEPADSTALPADSADIRSLREIEVTASGRRPVRRLPLGKIAFDPAGLLSASRRMGEVDIVNDLKMLAGVTTAGDYGSGLMVDGSESSQTVFRIAGAPVFFPYRFGGIFSTFNTPHFRMASFERNIHPAAMPPRLGAKLDFETFDALTPALSGVINVGMLASSATIRARAGRRFDFIASGRVSYVDEIYGALLRKDYTDIRYRFADLNLTANYRPGENDILSLNLFRSFDRLKYDDRHYDMDTRLRWNNSLASLRWRHFASSLSMNHRLYLSAFSNTLDLSLADLSLRAPASLGLLGAAGDISLNSGSDLWELRTGYEAGVYRNIVQWARLSGFGSTAADGIEPRPFRPFETRIYADATLRPLPWLDIAAGLSLEYFRNPRAAGYSRFSPDPRLTLTLRKGRNSWSIHAGRYSQFLHQVGFSEIGMSGDFWIAATPEAPAQSQWSFVADWARPLPWLGITADIELYWKRVYNQPEYVGQILDLLQSDYYSPRYIMVGSGYNTGANLTLRKEAGSITASLSAGYGVARRKFPGFGSYTRGRTDPGISLSAEASWRISRWTVGAAFRFNSGRPYTPAKAMYIIAGNLVTEYAEPNSARLPAYHRLDLYATFRLGRLRPDGSAAHLLNFSIVNAYGHRNVEFRKSVIDLDAGTIRIVEKNSLYRFLPSISYTFQF